tara:strand:+ start:2290 stop:3069 length:780 start_codon:yes stop_codon:yes gene_type:complete
MKTNKIRNSIIIYLVISTLKGDDISAMQVMQRVYEVNKPETSIMDIRLEIIRKKGNKEKIKVRKFTRYEKYYKKGKYRSKSIARFIEPKVIKGTGLLSWTQRDGQTQQWFFLPKLKTVKKIKAKEKSKSFLNTDFIYEDLESRKPGLDSLAAIGTEFLNGNQCRIIMAWPKNDSYYFSKKIWVSTQNWQICKVEYYSTESKKDKTLILSDFIEKNNFITPGKMIMDVGNGNKTIMYITSFQPDIGLNEDVFTKAFLARI